MLFFCFFVLAIRCITKAIKSIPVKRTGYCGVMLPVIEDTGLIECAKNEVLPKLFFYKFMSDFASSLRFQ